MAVAVSRSRAVTLRRRDHSGSSKSLQKALRLLLYLGEKGSEMGVTQLAAELGLNKATVYRLLSTMQEFKLIEQNPANQRYRLGLGGAERTQRRLRRYRTGAEGRISHLKRRYGLDRSRLKGDQGRQIWTEWAILAYNLDTIAVRKR